MKDCSARYSVASLFFSNSILLILAEFIEIFRCCVEDFFCEIIEYVACASDLHYVFERLHASILAKPFQCCASGLLFVRVKNIGFETCNNHVLKLFAFWRGSRSIWFRHPYPSSGLRSFLFKHCLTCSARAMRFTPSNIGIITRLQNIRKFKKKNSY